MSAFTPENRSTWRDILTILEVADILRRKAGGIRKACQTRTMVPTPAWDLGRPIRWRKTDVIRHIDGGVAAMRRVS